MFDYYTHYPANKRLSVLGKPDDGPTRHFPNWDIQPDIPIAASYRNSECSMIIFLCQASQLFINMTNLSISSYTQPVWATIEIRKQDGSFSSIFVILHGRTGQLRNPKPLHGCLPCSWYFRVCPKYVEK
ncbi:uncharacterized protein ZBAI_03871 [Zygosaccharomyces bailii ISA1307]|nr:uncharacterized protein ZBAI_03871 [Zygosaccharomyces bailii ISA1307]